MNNTLKILCVFGALSAFAACGDDDDKPDNNTPDTGIIVTLDSGVKDSSLPSIDANMQTPVDSGAVQPTGPKTKMTDFLNGPSPANVQTTTKVLHLLPAQVDPTAGK